ncbi:MAG TPA: ABC transporter permease, partial [Longimicrobiales bacterium]|nr:ABC transporter permease [Longimicrobiales bacterium]
MDRSIEEAAAGRTTGTIGSVRPSRVRTDLRGAFASVAALVGLLIGIRAVVDPGRDGVRALLGLPDIPRDRIGVLWSDSALWPGDAQAGALERLGALLASLLLAAAVVALVGSLLHLFEAGASRRRELALRAAVGAGPRALLLHAARSLRTLALAGGALGILLGLSAGALLRGLWPGTLAAVGWVDAAAWAPVLVAPLALLELAYLRTAWRLARGALLAPALLDGGRSTSGRGDAARRRVVPALQMGVAGAVVIGTWALLGAGTRAGPLAGDTPAGAVAIPVSAAGPVTPERWSDTLMRIAGLPGVEAGTLASSGALVGLGVRDHALAHCGACVRGGLPLPFWGAFADHHAVAPGFFSAAGMTVAEGRDLGPGDGPDAPRVALVNRTFADRAFERGRPIGKRVRLGATLHDWYTVVGVVEDFTTPVVGGDDVDRAAVWV